MVNRRDLSTVNAGMLLRCVTRSYSCFQVGDLVTVVSDADEGLCVMCNEPDYPVLHPLRQYGKNFMIAEGPW